MNMIKNDLTNKIQNSNVKIIIKNYRCKVLRLLQPVSRYLVFTYFSKNAPHFNMAH